MFHNALGAPTHNGSFKKNILFILPLKENIEHGVRFRPYGLLQNLRGVVIGALVVDVH